MVGFVHYDRNSAAFFDQYQGNWPYRLLMTHIYTDSCTGNGKILQPGRNSEHSIYDGQCVYQYGLDTSDRLSCSDLIELKTNGWIFQHNTIYDPIQVKVRHGRITSAPGQAGPAKGNLFLGNLWINGGTDLTVRGAYHRYINNWCIKSGSPSLDSPLGNGHISPTWGRSDGKFHPPTTAPSAVKVCQNRMSGYAIRAGGNRGFTVRVNTSTDCDAFIKPADCIATKTGQGRNSSVESTGWGSGLDTTTQLPDADIDKIPVMMTSSKVGPRGWRSQFASVYKP
jgi:hypothetical protein